jgi:hypothetical protein
MELLPALLTPHVRGVVRSKPVTRVEDVGALGTAQRRAEAHIGTRISTFVKEAHGVRNAAARNNEAGAQTATGWLTAVRRAERKTGTYIDSSATDDGERRAKKAREQKGHRAWRAVWATRLYSRVMGTRPKSSSFAINVLRSKLWTTRGQRIKLSRMTSRGCIPTL